MSARGKPKILGILNITEDSFSDGGLYLKPEKALSHARRLLREGADIIDLGAASSHPDARAVSHEEEKKRLQPLLQALLADDVPVSVDSFLPKTQRTAMEAGVHYLNDVQGFPDAALYGALAKSACKLIVMHSIQSHGKATYAASPKGEMEEKVYRFFDARLEALQKGGVSEERIILDPGMGFFLGNKPEKSFKMLASLAAMKARFSLPLLVSVSRKSFLQKAAKVPPQKTAAASLAAEIYAALQGVDFIRTHEPLPLSQALKILSHIPQNSRDPQAEHVTKGYIS